jgi:hypothetical protein
MKNYLAITGYLIWAKLIFVPLSSEKKAAFGYFVCALKN